MNPFSVLSFNIRCEYGADGPNGWEYRKEQVFDLLRMSDADLIGFQEVTPIQSNDLGNLLSGYFGLTIGRDDGISGEATAIYVKEERFDILDKGYFWCSATPEKAGSIGWDAVFPRIVAYVVLKDKQCAAEFCFFNTHFDHVGKIARRMSSRLLIQKAQEISQGKAILVVGDFNAKPRTETIRLFLKNGYSESKRTIKPKRGQPKVSFHAFQYDPQRSDPSMEWIDYIFTKGFHTLDFDVIASSVNGRYPSDHFPISATVQID
ncbi:MAG TPA: hypothetical protein DCQ90_04205 [Erysipelotrichaceae bacterium]|nr:hypothetical protein [Erysipelotrichaceae bacterium]